jgi:MFS family permease
MIETLRPSTLGEILDRTAELYRRHFLRLVGVAAAPMGAMMAVAALFVLFIFAIPGISGQQFAMTALLVGALVLVGVPVILAASVFSQGALASMAIKAHMGEQPTVRAALLSVWPRFWRYLWLMILMGIFVALIPMAAASILIAILAGLAALAKGGSAAPLAFLIFLVFAATVVVVVERAICYSLAFPVCVAEDRSAWKSLRRAAELSKGARWRIFVMFLLILALTMVASIVVAIPFLIVVTVVTAVGHGTQYASAFLIIAGVIRFLADFALQILITPVSVMALVVFYYDQRIRKEGFDIERMMQAAGLTKFEIPAEVAPVPSVESIVNPATVME